MKKLMKKQKEKNKQTKKLFFTLWNGRNIIFSVFTSIQKQVFCVCFSFFSFFTSNVEQSWSPYIGLSYIGAPSGQGPEAVNLRMSTCSA